MCRQKETATGLRLPPSPRTTCLARCDYLPDLPLAAGAFCVTATDFPATVTAPVRCAPALARTVTLMVAEPALPAPTVAHEIPELAVHVHPVCVVTVRFAEP